ncbi:MAG TPA: mechanosensitive ion channel family protein [Alphaproteobacteria bacterium]|nr:mechanosensitive ion channel family protein [Alphaproteobacteria bacterium]HNS44009.1 mechanosensitive ion channel family protein [Alphaproteobacteria bacterium]
MTRIIPLFLFLFFVVFVPMSVMAQNGSEAVNKEDVRKLVDTLENDQSRSDLVNNLKLLLEEQKKQEEPMAPLTEAIGMRSGVEKAVAEYEAFLDKNKLSSSLVHQSVGTFVVLLVASGFWFGVRKLSRKILRVIERMSQRFGITLSRFGTYTTILQTILKVIILALSVYTLGKIWSASSIDAFFESDQMRAFLGTSFTVLFVAFFAAVIWEGVGVYLSYILKQADVHNETRVKTLLPIVKNVVLGVFAVLFGLVLLSEVGVNVTPLLAGAGVIGVAIGFGAQSMVKDFLTGFTIILEDIVRVGDVVNLGGHAGLVEKITLRKVQLRDVAGIVYTIPFSEITTIQNLTKDYSFYVFDIGVTYNVDTDRVIEVLRGVDEELRGDGEYGPLILEPLEVMGVDQFADSAVIIKARIKTMPIQQWKVGREFNRRMKHAFDVNGIEIPFPQRVVTVLQKESMTA